MDQWPAELVVVQDDLDGTEGATTVKFGLDGRSYEIDLSEKNEKASRKTLEKYLDAATQAAKSPAAAGGRKRRYRSRTPRHKEHPATAARGREINDCGRIPTDLMQRYEAANTGR